QETELVYAFWRDNTGVHYAAVHRVTCTFPQVSPLDWTGLEGLQRLAIHCGGHLFLAYERLHDGSAELWQSVFKRNSQVSYDLQHPSDTPDDSLTELTPIPITPLFRGPFNITQGSSSDRRSLTEAVFMANTGNSLSNIAYIEEAYYFVPIYLALQLQA